MTISLRIDNVDALPDGGPLSYRANQRGFEIGREHRDWTLPDPNMFISGRHCEIRYEKGGYWLYDVSRNGTFVNGASQRVRSPHPLADGDRLKIGHYLISVSIDAAGDAEEGEASPFQAPARNSDNIWDTGEPAPPPISRRELMAREKQGQRSADFAERHLDLPPVISSNPFEDFAKPAERPAAQQPDSFAPAPGESPFGQDAAPQRKAYPAAGQPSPAVRPPSPFDFGGEPFAPPSYPTPAATPQPQRPATPTPPAAHQPGGGGSAGAEAILRAIAAGAGVSPNVFLQRDQADVAAEIGTVLRAVIEELAILLKARAAAKVMAKSSNRTMIGAVDNNPLKFVPRPEEVLEIMFARRAGYLDAKRSVDEAFHDLKTHEFATYAAMQKALARLLEDLSPEAIEKKVSSSAFASRKTRAWETFVATWEAMEKPHENGMLDVFLAYFSDAYAKASKPK
ncbi:type VI secretion system-associated FHA domain protein TagH [Mesorhizobium sp. BAC0120]|uniref:type VI secretion system-associated FHA domain protein TagH n=1 Tax=Mesorhizobium sp. BAC0120 TaxID=3090670 RepID=UPI00298D1B72|nr:type VI secretion system-associated FHA domain protein TagH [Mesorhizobium sp. BAC0120]MDW6025441.1 type VI secretion system-associated FHA domain protein TagH [Mesorhizobium sp. BAC0120]